MDPSPTSEATSKPEYESRQDVAAIAGRGTVYITVAKAYFVVTGLATYLVLPRILTQDQFGLYSVVVGVVSIINAVVVTGTTQTVSRFVSEDPRRASSVTRKALQVQLLAGGLLAGGFCLLAPIIAHLLHDDRLIGYLRLSALITLIYSFYAVFLGALNGRRAFLKQASLDALYSTFKLVFVVTLAWLGYSVVGALGGWLLAGLVVLGFSIWFVGLGNDPGQPRLVRARDLLNFQALVLILILIVNLLQRFDVLMVKALSSPDREISSGMAGFYNAVMTIAGVTFQSIIALPMVAFPFISESTSNQDIPGARRYIEQTMRFSLMIMALLAALFSSNAAGLLGLIYPPEYLAGTAALRIAPFGMLMFGLLYVLTTVISGSGRPGAAVGIGIGTLAADVLLSLLMIPQHGLAGAAMASLGALALGAGLCGLYVRRQLGALLSLGSGIRISAAALVIYLLPSVMTGTGAITIVRIVLQAAIYFALLSLSGELGPNEFTAMRRIFSRK